MVQYFQNYFNSIKVQLERGALGVASSLLGFQFHKGTIRTALLGDVSASGNVFQFHKGTIRTLGYWL